MILEDKINILIADKDNEIHDFIEECVVSEGREKILNVMNLRSYENIPQNGIIEIFIIGECDKNEETIPEVIDRIRKGQYNKGSYIFVATRNTESEFLKSLINKRIYGLIDKKDKDCSRVIEAIEKAVHMQCLVEHLKNKAKKLKDVVQ